MPVERLPRRTHLGLFDRPPSRRESQLGLSAAGLLLAAFFLPMPVYDWHLPEFQAFIPTIFAILFASELIICVKLNAQASVFRSRALTLLSSCFVFSAVLAGAYLLSFPGAFSPNGLFGDGINTPAWLAYLRLWAFPISVVAYVWLKSADSAGPLDIERAPAPVLQATLGSIALAVLLTILAARSHDLLPPMFLDHRETIYPHLLVANAVSIALTLAAMIVLFLRRGSVLDMWLLVALWASLIEMVLNLWLHERFVFGWYWLVGIMLASNLILMVALVAESNLLYARLALSTAAREREHEVRAMSMDAVAAAFAHEVGQPFTAVVLSAKAGLNSLRHAPPDHQKAMDSLSNALDAGQRGLAVVKSIRENVAKERKALSQFSLNDLVCETTSLLSVELTAHQVSLQLALDNALPPVIANRVQMQRVLINLLTNAIESLDATRRRNRRIAIRSAQMDDQQVVLEVSDTGAGIAPEKMAQIFNPFFTTKQTGTGLGLSLSRTIVEEHGGLLWASANKGHGATFHLQIPSSPTPGQ